MSDDNELRKIRATLVQILGEMRVANKIALHGAIRDANNVNEIERTRKLIDGLQETRENHEP